LEDASKLEDTLFLKTAFFLEGIFLQRALFDGSIKGRPRGTIIIIIVIAKIEIESESEIVIESVMYKKARGWWGGIDISTHQL